MTSLKDIISSKQEEDVESDNDSFAEVDAIPVVPNRPTRPKSNEEDLQPETVVSTPQIPQRPKKRSVEETKSVSTPVVPQRPLKKEVEPIVVQEEVEEPDFSEEGETDTVEGKKDVDDNLLRPDYNDREAQIEAITSDAESIAELDEYDDEDDEDEGEELAPDPTTSRPNNGDEEPFPSPTGDDFIARVDDELEELKLMTSKRDPVVLTPGVPEHRPHHVPHHRSIAHIDPKAMARTSTADLRNEVEELYSAHHICHESAPDTPVSGIIHPQRSQNVPKRPSIATALAASTLHRTGTDELKEEVTELYSSEHVCGDSAIATPLDTPLRKDSAVFFDQNSGSQVDVSSGGKDEQSAPVVEPVVPKRPSKSKQVPEEVVVPEKPSNGTLPQDETSKPLLEEPVIPQRPTKTEPSVPKRPSKPVPEEEPVVPARPVSTEPGRTTEPKIEKRTTDEPTIPERPKAKGPPVVPKKPSSKIAAFQEMLRKNQEREQMEIQHRPSSTRRSVGHEDSQKDGDEEPVTQTRSAFKQNLSGLFALPGMALPGMKPPSVLSSETKDDAGDESAEPVTNDARRARARGPRGKRLPKSASEKVEVVDRRVISVTDVWSTGCESEGYVLNKEEDKKSKDTPVVEELDVEDIPVEKVQTEEFVEEPNDDLVDDVEEEAEEFEEVSTPAENDDDLTDTEETISVSTADVTSTIKNRTETSQPPSEENHSSSTVDEQTPCQEGDVNVAQGIAEPTAVEPTAVEPTVVEPTAAESSILHNDGDQSDQSDLESFHDAENVSEIKE